MQTSKGAQNADKVPRADAGLINRSDARLVRRQSVDIVVMSFPALPQVICKLVKPVFATFPHHTMFHLPREPAHPIPPRVGGHHNGSFRIHATEGACVFANSMAAHLWIATGS